MNDDKRTEAEVDAARMAMTREINAMPSIRQKLEELHGQVWDTTEMQRDFELKGFAAPFVIVTRKSDGVLGSLTFQHSPRFYWGFEASR